MMIYFVKQNIIFLWIEKKLPLYSRGNLVCRCLVCRETPTQVLASFPTCGSHGHDHS